MPKKKPAPKKAAAPKKVAAKKPAVKRAGRDRDSEEE